jgi:hypothetical protein
MSSTKNTKVNRQVVRATFDVPESVFKIPDGLDLEDKTIVEYWYVRYNALILKYVNGEKISIDPTWINAEVDMDLKETETCEIVKAEEVGYEYSEDEDDDEDDAEDDKDDEDDEEDD